MLHFARWRKGVLGHMLECGERRHRHFLTLFLAQIRVLVFTGRLFCFCGGRHEVVVVSTISHLNFAFLLRMKIYHSSLVSSRLHTLSPVAGAIKYVSPP